MFLAPEPVEIPEHMTTEKTLGILKAELQAKEMVMQATLKRAASEGIADAVKVMEEFKSLYFGSNLVARISEEISILHFSRYLKQMDLSIIQLTKAHDISMDVRCSASYSGELAMTNTMLCSCRSSQLLCSSFDRKTHNSEKHTSCTPSRQRSMGFENDLCCGLYDAHSCCVVSLPLASGTWG